MKKFETIDQLLEVIAKYREAAEKMCSNFCSQFCEICPFVEYDICLGDLSDFFSDLIEADWYPVKPKEDAENLQQERRVLMEYCDRLAAENCQLEIQMDELKKNGLENQILRERLTKETLANLEMQIALDLHEIYAKEREENVYNEC